MHSNNPPASPPPAFSFPLLLSIRSCPLGQVRTQRRPFCESISSSTTYPHMATYIPAYSTVLTNTYCTFIIGLWLCSQTHTVPLSLAFGCTHKHMYTVPLSLAFGCAHKHILYLYHWPLAALTNTYCTFIIGLWLCSQTHVYCTFIIDLWLCSQTHTVPLSLAFGCAHKHILYLYHWPLAVLTNTYCTFIIGLWPHSQTHTVPLSLAFGCAHKHILYLYHWPLALLHMYVDACLHEKCVLILWFYSGRV